MTLLALVVAVTAGAQTGLVEFPYNPDADNDDIIGTADLLALLSLYGSEFSEEDIYLSTDSTTALYYAGYFDFAMCLHQCSNLAGDWHIASRKQFCQVIHPSQSSVEGWAWLEPIDAGRTLSDYGNELVLAVGESLSEINSMYTYNSAHCFCFTEERRKVEYSYCEGQYQGDLEFQSCCDSKVAAGWYPLGSLNTNAGNDPSQAFWRWAE